MEGEQRVGSKCRLNKARACVMHPHKCWTILVVTCPAAFAQRLRGRVQGQSLLLEPFLEHTQIYIS